MDSYNETVTNAHATAARKDIFSYDYVTVEASGSSAPEIADCYEAMGWKLANHHDNFGGGITLNFKRDRRIKNKDQLTRLQVKLDDSIRGIAECEERKTRSATIVSIIFGVIGALIFGGGMSMAILITETWAMIAGIALGIIGAGIASLGYIAYRKLRAKNTAKMDVQIDKKRDEISRLCEDAEKLLRQ